MAAPAKLIGHSTGRLSPTAGLIGLAFSCWRRGMRPALRRSVTRLLFRSRLSALSLLLSIAACAANTPASGPVPLPSGDGKADALGCGDACPTPMRFATFNLGLAHGAVKLATERLPGIVDALASSDADVVCLQEVWEDADAEALMGELAEVYPHSFREATVSNEHKYFECTTSALELWSLKSCVDDECQTQSLFQCVGEGGACRDPYTSIPDDCKRCLAANALSPAKCLLRAPTTAYGGRNGLLVLSRHPLEDARYEDYDTGILRRGVISARVKDYEVLCTHMTSDLADVPPYPADEMPFASWSEEHMAQVERLSEMAADDRCAVLMGDMNAGPGTNTITPELGSHYDAFLAHGYSEPWMDPVCTFCSTNPLVCIDDGANEQTCAEQSSLWLDHIFFTSACSGGASYRRVFDQPIDVESNGEQVQTRLSDHYGLMAEHYADLF